jgi:lipid-binding SYLF domain-containing protein
MRPKEALLIALILVAIFFALYPMRVEMGGEDTSTVNAAKAVLTKAVESPSSGIPTAVLENAQAVVVIPSIVEGTLMTGRGSGEGLMVVRRDDGTWSSPSFVRFYQTRAGSGDGFQVRDAVLVFNTRPAISAMENGLPLGSHASIAPGPRGQDVRAMPDRLSGSDVLFYVQSGGAPDATVLRGAVLQIDHIANAYLYKSDHVTIESILTGKAGEAPLPARAFTCTVAKHTGSAQTC